ncbi:unnamed protein product [Arctogadus glacialis]
MFAIVMSSGKSSVRGGESAGPQCGDVCVCGDISLWGRLCVCEDFSLWGTCVLVCGDVCVWGLLVVGTSVCVCEDFSLWGTCVCVFVGTPVCVQLCGDVSMC